MELVAPLLPRARVVFSTASVQWHFISRTPRRFRSGHSSRPLQVLWLEREGFGKPHGGDNRAASRRARRRLSARYGPTRGRAPSATVAIARPRVSAPPSPAPARARRETAERGPRLAEDSRRAESASERFFDAPGGGGASRLLRSWGGNLTYAVAYGGATPMGGGGGAARGGQWQLLAIHIA